MRTYNSLNLKELSLCGRKAKNQVLSGTEYVTINFKTLMCFH